MIEVATRSQSLVKSSVSRPAIAVRPAAIWARVSTTSQAETSLPCQVARCKDKLESTGYSVVHTYQVDWTSLDLWACPQFQELRQLIANREIQALALYDRDRLEAKGLQRLVFLSELKENGVELVICQGPPVIDGPEGQIVELALAIGKERQVLRARAGSKDGLHDRAVKFGKPVTFHKLYGYQWDKASLKLVPSDDYPTLKLIFGMLLDGSGYQPILDELKRQGISSPAGLPEWNKTALSNIIHNPVYAGRYYALKKVAVEPKKRKTNSYGNSSVRKLPLDQAHYMPEVQIVEAPITWEQREHILTQLAQHQKLSQRNAKHDYLLRGFIYCWEHLGKNGEPRRFHGIPKRGSFYYCCPVGGCKRSYINGPDLDERAKRTLMAVLLFQERDFYEAIGGERNQEESLARLRHEIAACERREENKLHLEAKLEDQYLNRKVAQEVYELLKTKYQAERQGAVARKVQLESELEQLGRQREAFASLAELRKKFIIRLYQLTTAQYRELFTLLNFRIDVGKPVDDFPEWTAFAAKYNADHPKKPGLYSDIKFYLGIPLPAARKLGRIVLPVPAPG